MPVCGCETEKRHVLVGARVCLVFRAQQDRVERTCGETLTRTPDTRAYWGGLLGSWSSRRPSTASELGTLPSAHLLGSLVLYLLSILINSRRLIYEPAGCLGR